MKQFEKYIENELNNFKTFIFNLNLKWNKNFKKKFDYYKMNCDNLKQMFLINTMEKEISFDNNLKNIDVSVETYFKHFRKDKDILDYMAELYSK